MREGAVPTSLKRKFQRRLVKWYRRHGRDLPWRRVSDPYAILVSEIMLQQTQVDRVIPKYHEFLSRYPTVHALAKAPVGQVKKSWYPLGYNIRPVHLHSIARETVAKYAGQLPSREEDLLAFKGIGRYTAGAIRTFAFNEDAPILDTNVRRVLHRIFIGPKASKPKESAMWALSKELLPPGRSYDYNQGLMDFGACVCVPRNPDCPRCPMKEFCKTYELCVSSGRRRSAGSRRRTGRETS